MALAGTLSSIIAAPMLLVAPAADKSILNSNFVTLFSLLVYIFLFIHIIISI